MDLFFRLNVFPIHVPALRERLEDIPLLVDYFAGRLTGRMGKKITRIETRSLSAMQQYSWPGNVRELQNIIERSVILADSEVLRVDPGTLVHEPLPCISAVAAESGSGGSDRKSQIETVLRETRGKVYGPNGAALLYPVFIVLSALRLNARLCVFTGAVAAIEYSTLALYFVGKTSTATVEPILTSMPHHIIRGLLLLVIGVVTGLVTIQIKKRTLNSFVTVEERNRIRRTFGEYVSPLVMEKLLTLKPDLASEHRSVCVMFLDIRNFSAFAERRTPEAAVVAYLESLFEFMIEIVNRHHGIINKFLGDGFMAVFGAPVSDGADCLNGVEAAREIILRVEREVAAANVLPTRVGIGLHAGEAVTGSIGSALRKEYAVIGDVVNVASRIEQLNKEFGSQLLISETVWQAVSYKFGDATPIGAVRVKGREAPVQLWQVV